MVLVIFPRGYSKYVCGLENVWKISVCASVSFLSPNWELQSRASSAGVLEEVRYPPTDTQAPSYDFVVNWYINIAILSQEFAMQHTYSSTRGRRLRCKVPTCTSGGVKDQTFQLLQDLLPP